MPYILYILEKVSVEKFSEHLKENLPIGEFICLGFQSQTSVKHGYHICHRFVMNVKTPGQIDRGDRINLYDSISSARIVAIIPLLIVEELASSYSSK